MFLIVEKQLENSDDRELNVLRNTFKIYQNRRALSLNEYADEKFMSRERVRQLRKKIFAEILSPQSLFFAFRDNWSHYQPMSADAIWEQDIQHYLDDEQCSLSSKFVLHILLNLLYSDYSIYGGLMPAIMPTRWKNTFIVKNNIACVFDFDKFRETFHRLLLKNKSDCVLNIKKYVGTCKCWKQRKFLYRDSVVNIARDIIRYEFQLNVESDGCFKIPASKRKVRFDVIYNILKNNGNPMHLLEIFEEFKKALPERRYASLAKLRHYLLKHDAVACRNRNSVYVLKEWTHVKSGTIRDAIVEFLAKKKLPQTARSITDYVLQHFPETNISSVRTSIFNDTQNRFVFFEGGFFGLTKKKYSPKYIPADNSLPTFADRMAGMEKFIAENGHFPFASSTNRDERILGVWWIRVTRQINQLDEAQRKEVDRAKTQYAGLAENKRLFRWDENCEKLKCFVRENHRIPSVGTETFFYHWFGKAKSDFLNNRLNKSQQQKYLELMELF
jgi:hypothetical protein